MSRASVWEDKYLRLKEGEHGYDALKKKCNEQAETIKRMYTKLAKIRESLKRKGIPNPDDFGGGNYTRDERDLIDDLRSRNETLTRANAALTTQVKKLRAEVQRGGSRRGRGGRMRNRSGPVRSSPRIKNGKSGNRIGLSTLSNQSQNNSPRKDGLENMLRSFASSAPNQRTQQLVNALRARVASTEAHMQRLAQDRDNLSRRIAKQSNSSSTYSNNHDVSYIDDELRILRRDLRDQTAQRTLMETRYDNLKAKADAAKDIQERTMAQMDQYNLTIRELRRNVQDMSANQTSNNLQKQRILELEDELRVAKDDAHDLENRMQQLCESPFINDAVARRDRLEKLVTSEKTIKQQNAQIEHLQETVKVQYSTNQNLRHQIDNLRKKSETIKENNNYRVVSGGSSNQNFNDDEGTTFDKNINFEDSNINLNVQSGMKSKSGDTILATGDDTVQSLKVKLQTTQTHMLEACDDLQRTERMLELQTRINKELETEISELKSLNSSSPSHLKEMLAKVQLELQDKNKKLNDLLSNGGTFNSQHVQSTNSNEMVRSKVSNDTVIQSDINDKISRAHFGLNEGMVAMGETVLEIWVKHARLDPGMVNHNSSTFCMIDFYDFESQTTPVVAGIRPDFNFAATYRIRVDDFLLVHLCRPEGVVHVELNLVEYTDFEQLAVAELPLFALLSQARNPVVCVDCPLRRESDGLILGTLFIEARLASPLNVTWQTFLDEHPKEAKRVNDELALYNEHGSGAKGSVHTGVGTSSVEAHHYKHLTSNVQPTTVTNHIEVSVKACSGLYKGRNNAPSPYVHYHMQGHGDTMTNVVSAAFSPTFNHKRAFAILVDKEKINAIRGQRMLFTVFDDSDHNIASSGVVGTAVVPLKRLANGDEIRGRFDITDSDGQEGGILEVVIKWRDELKLPDKVMVSKNVSFETSKTVSKTTFDPNHHKCPMNMTSLSSVMDKFSVYPKISTSDGKESIINISPINYVSFVQWASPKPSILEAQKFLRLKAIEFNGTSIDENTAMKMFRDALEVQSESKDENESSENISTDGIQIVLDKLKWSTNARVLNALSMPIKDGGCGGNINRIVELMNCPTNESERKLEESIHVHSQVLSNSGISIFDHFNDLDSANLSDSSIPSNKFVQALVSLGFIASNDAEKYFKQNNIQSDGTKSTFVPLEVDILDTKQETTFEKEKKIFEALNNSETEMAENTKKSTTENIAMENVAGGDDAHNNSNNETNVAEDVAINEANSNDDKTVENVEFLVGQVVEANYDNQDEWFPGVIKAIHKNDDDITYDVAYDDGDFEEKLSNSRIRIVESNDTKIYGEKHVNAAVIIQSHQRGYLARTSNSQENVANSFKLGDAIDANYDNNGEYFSGTIAKVHEDNTYDIDYDDGDKESSVSASLIRTRSV